MTEPTNGRIKLIACLVAALCCIGVGYKLAPVHPAKEVTIYVDRVVVKDRIVTKDVVRTETRPDGTKIVTTENERSTEHTSEAEKIRQTTIVTPSPKTHYSLGINLRPESIFSFKGIYTLEVGKRLWETPIWVTASGNTKKEFTLGVRVEL